MAKIDEDVGNLREGRGKRPNQKLKPYIVLQYLMRKTDENHVIAVDVGENSDKDSIVKYLWSYCGIDAERRGIYRDIDEINVVHVMLEEECTFEEAKEILEDDPSRKLVCYTHKGEKGFYINSVGRHYDLNDIRLLAECVYSAKFLSQGQSDRLAGVVSGFVSEHQAKKIQHDAFLTDRVKTANKAVLRSISTINDAMSKELDGEKHTPEKVSFQYLKYTISDTTKQVERKKGQRYVVSPFKLLINDGNYYLLAYNDEVSDMRTYRVDRMKDVHAMGTPREGEEAFRQIDLKTYTQRVFSMFGGEKQRVTLQFINPLLDAVVDRFGNQGVSYWQKDAKHICVAVDIEVSDAFFGWVLGFGNKVKILEPNPVVKSFTAYLDKIRGLYRG